VTRINIDFTVKNLTDKHLLAEHRGIKRIPKIIKSGKAEMENIPEKFCLGKGHIKFFYNKLGYLYRRYISIYLECVNRGFGVQDYSTAWKGVPAELMGDYKPTEEDKKLIEDRIISE